MFQTTHTASRRHHRGSALIVAIGATLPLVVAGGAMLVAVTQESRRTEVATITVKARDVAASGCHDALAKLDANPAYAGTYDLVLDGATAHVVVTPWANDKIDNDGNGVVDDAGEANFIGVTSDGSVNDLFDQNRNLIARETLHGRSLTTAVVQKTQLNIAVNQAMYVDDGGATFKLSGTQFLISGNDTNIDNTKGPNAPIPGIGTVGDPAAIKNQIAKNQKNCVVGQGSNPSVQTVADVDMTTTMSTYGALATLTWNGPDDSYSGNIGDRTKLIPIVAHAKGNLKLNGNTQGCALLIVDGDLTVNGTFDFVGVMYVAGKVTFNGGGGNKDLHGALLTSANSNGIDADLNGTVQIRYSSQAIGILNTQLSSGVTLVSWAQK